MFICCRFRYRYVAVGKLFFREGHGFADNQQLLWGVDTTLKRRLTLMLLFSGAVFIILAGTIRAITILTVSFPSPTTQPPPVPHLTPNPPSPAPKAQ
jgi:hypothetical protein